MAGDELEENATARLGAVLLHGSFAIRKNFRVPCGTLAHLCHGESLPELRRLLGFSFVVQLFFLYFSIYADFLPAFDVNWRIVVPPAESACAILAADAVTGPAVSSTNSFSGMRCEGAATLIAAIA